MAQDLPVTISVEDKEAARRLGALKSSFDGFANNISEKMSTANQAMNSFLGNTAARLFERAIQAVAQTMRETVEESRNFSKGMAEINSILPKNAQLTDQNRIALTEFAAAYGTKPSEQAKAFYEVISAGITGVGNQLELLRVANQSAVAGLTNTKTSVDVLTSALNTFGKQGLTAQQASDQLFVAVREGKTTFDQLASTLGRVNPIAQAAGLSFGDVAGSVAFLTKAGISTDEAVVGLRGVLTSVIRPSEEAQKVARSLGIEFNTAGLKAKGLADFLKDLGERTGGSEEVLSKLFPDVRALVPILAAVRGDFADFNRILGETKNSSGATSSALEAMKNSIDFQLDQAAARTQAGLQQIFLIFERDLVQLLKIFNGNGFSFTGMIDSLAQVGQAITYFLIRPLEVVFNFGSRVFGALVVGGQGLVALFAKMGQGLALAAEALGMQGPWIQNLKTFGESASEVAAQSKAEFEAVGKSTDFFDQTASANVDGYFEKVRERIAGLQPQIDAVKEQVATGFATTMDVAADPAAPTAGDPFAAARLGLTSFEQALTNGFDVSVPAALEKFKAFVEDVKAFSMQIKNALIGGVASGAGQAFAAFGKAVASGEDPLKAFLNSFMATMGQMAIQVGTMFILKGIAYSLAGMPNGPALIAAGAALATFGGVMGAVFSGGGATGGGGYMGGGSGVSTLQSSDELLTPGDQEEKRKTEINVTVQGNVFDSHETGLKLVQAIRDSVERDGVVLVQTA